MSDAVLDLIKKNGLAYTVSGKDYLIHCLNPEHPDSNPSFRVDKISGVAHCFGCGFATNLFKYYGVFTNTVPIKIASLKEKLAALKTMHSGLDLPKGATPYTKSFRGVSAQTLKHFGAFYTTEFEPLEDRICFPIKDITGKTQVFVGRHTLSTAGKFRYVNYPSGVSMPIYPPSVPPGHTSAVLVEGLFDMLNLHDKGLTNAICVFGTNTLAKDIKLKLLPLRAQGVTHIYIMFDGDAAGEKAAELLKPMIEQQQFIVEIIQCEEGTDPGEMSKDDVESLKNYIS